MPNARSHSVIMYTYCHGQLTLKQLRLSILNEMHTNLYMGARLNPLLLVDSIHCNQPVEDYSLSCSQKVANKNIFNNKTS